MKAGMNWRKFTREAKNGMTTKATYHEKYVHYSSFIMTIFLCLVEFNLNLFLIRVNQQKQNMNIHHENHFMVQFNIIKVI